MNFLAFAFLVILALFRTAYSTPIDESDHALVDSWLVNSPTHESTSAPIPSNPVHLVRHGAGTSGERAGIDTSSPMQSNTVAQDGVRKQRTRKDKGKSRISCYATTSVAMDADVDCDYANFDTKATSSTLSGQSTNDESKNRRAGKPWTVARREKYNQTIATRVKTEKMKTNWSNGRRRRGSNTRPQAESSADATTTTTTQKRKYASWTPAQREKYRHTIATRTVTDEMRENWSNAHRGAQHTEDTKFLMAMRKLGTRRLPDGAGKRTRRQDEGVRRPERLGRPYSDAGREAKSIAQKTRWAKVRADEQQQLADDPSVRKPSQVRVSMSIAAKARWAKVRAREQEKKSIDRASTSGRQ